MNKPIAFGPPPRAVIYTRVSTGSQEENTSLAAQFAACSKKAQELGAEIVQHYEETLSGGLYLARPEIQKALHAIEAGQANTLIIYKLDRTGRELDGLRDIRRRIERAGGHLVFADGMQFQKNALGNLMFTQMGAFAEFEREMIRERMVNGLYNTVREGRMVARATPPYGYHIARHADVTRGLYTTEQLGHYFVVEEQARWVREIFRLYDSGWSLRRICAWLYEQGAPTARGGHLWKPASLRHILMNEAYKGTATYGKTRQVMDEGRMERGLRPYHAETRPDAEWVRIPCPPLVSEELWQRCQQRFATAREQNSGRTDRRYALTGIGRCPICGERLYSRSYASTRTRVERLGVYRCGRSLRRAPTDPVRCDKRHFNGPLVERYVFEAVVALFRAPQLLAQAQTRYQSQQRRRTTVQSTASEKRELEKELEQLRRKERVIAESRVEARISGTNTAAFDDMLREVSSQRQQKERRLEQLMSVEESSQAGARLDFKIAPEMADVLEKVLFSDTSTGAEKSELLVGIIDRVFPVTEASLSEKERAARQAIASGPRLVGRGKNKGDLRNDPRGNVRNTLGVKIVLRTLHTRSQQVEGYFDQGPYLILSNVAGKIDLRLIDDPKLPIHRDKRGFVP
jgi:site-specific DNA recombinase